MRARFVLVIALALTAGCSLPSVSQTGEIEAGAGGACPPGQVSRWGLCCGERTTLAECPTEAQIPRRQVGAITCSAQNSCEQGYECRFGRCCPPSSSLEQCPAESFVPNRQVGAVACDDQSACDRGYECRFGRCCPESASIERCPTQAHVPRVADGSLLCDSRGRCPNAHGYSCVQGFVCCPSGTDGTGPCAPGAPGNACTGSTMCRAYAPGTPGTQPGACFTSVTIGGLGVAQFLADLFVRIPVPNGYCSQRCKAAQFLSCGSAGYCLTDLRDFSAPAEFDGLCLARCRFPANEPYSPCRVDPATDGGASQAYSCFPVTPGNNSTEGYCFPDCVRDDYCARQSSPQLQLRCNRTTHRCESSAPPMPRDV